MRKNIWVQGKVVGYVENGVFVKRVHSSRHFLYAPAPAISFDLMSLRVAHDFGAKYVHIIDLDEQKHYWSTLTNIRDNWFAVERGYGKQRAMLVTLWSSTKEDCRKPMSESA